MGRRAHTIATFQVRITVPSRSNVSAAQQYIRDALCSHGGGLDPKDPYFCITSEQFTVALTKRETTYA